VNMSDSTKVARFVKVPRQLQCDFSCTLLLFLKLCLFIKVPRQLQYDFSCTLLFFSLAIESC